jgi:hypothetical protein
LEVNYQEIANDLDGHAYNSYSQWGEDGILEEIFNRIGTANKWCLECGAGDGLFMSNTRKLIEDGWTGILIEADANKMERLSTNSAPYEAHCFNVRIGPDDKLDDILASVTAPMDIDLVVIDIDGQDFYAWNSMLRYIPRVVVIEYDAHGGDPYFLPTLGGKGQAGLHQINGLAFGKTYRPVWRSYSNLIFVRHPLEQSL